MSDSSIEQREAALEKARRDLMVAGVVAAAVMIGAALFAPSHHLWGVSLGALIALANLSVLGRIGAELLGGEQTTPTVALRAVAKVLGLMAVVVAVLYSRPHLAFGLCIGLALPAVAGLFIALRGTPRRARESLPTATGETRE